MEPFRTRSVGRDRDASRVVRHLRQATQAGGRRSVEPSSWRPQGLCPAKQSYAAHLAGIRRREWVAACRHPVTSSHDAAALTAARERRPGGRQPPLAGTRSNVAHGGGRLCTPLLARLAEYGQDKPERCHRLAWASDRPRRSPKLATSEKTPSLK